MLTDLIKPLPPGQTLMDLGDTRELRIVREGESNSIWAFGRTRKLFFMCGHARSGTTWASRVLMLHPAIFMNGEFHFQQLKQGFDRFRRHDWHMATKEPVATAAECCFQDTIRLCLGAAAQSTDAEWIGDRTPRPLVPLLPGAPHFLVVRDGRDVVVSLAITEFRDQGGYYKRFQDRPKMQELQQALAADKDFFRKNPDELLTCQAFVRALARGWAKQATHDAEVLDAMKQGELDATGHLIIYEGLHTDPENERRKMYEFLDVDPDQAAPLSHETGTMPGLKKEDPTADSRKGVIGDWQNHFSDAAKDWFKQEAGQALITMGYEDNMDW